ncbi:MAG: hypothetical protein RR768_08450 [Clostridium sp.]
MNSFASVTGIITQIQPDPGDGASYGCSLTVTVQTFYREIVIFSLNGDTYVVDNALLQAGSQVTIFYDKNAPAPLIYPPKFKAVVAAVSNNRQYYLGEFYNSFISTDQTIQINETTPLRFFLPNGQIFSGAIMGKTVLVEYTSASKSIPALVTSSRIIVFCYI